MAVVAHHPVVIHFEGVGVTFHPVDVKLTVFDLQRIALVHFDGPLVDVDVVFIQRHGHPLGWDDDRAVIVEVPGIELGVREHIFGIITDRRVIGFDAFDVVEHLQLFSILHCQVVQEIAFGRYRSTFRNIHFLQRFGVESTAVGLHMVFVLCPRRLFNGLSVDVHHAVYNAQGIAGDAHAALDVVVLLVHRSVILHRIIEHHHVVVLDFAEAGQAAVFPFDPLQIRLGPQKRHGVVGEGEAQGRHGEARAVAQLAHKEEIADHQRLLHGGCGDGVGLDGEGADQGGCHYGKHNGFRPFAGFRFHDLVFGRFLLPKLPVHSFFIFAAYCILRCLDVHTHSIIVYQHTSLVGGVNQNGRSHKQGPEIHAVLCHFHFCFAQQLPNSQHRVYPHGDVGRGFMLGDLRRDFLAYRSSILGPAAGESGHGSRHSAEQQQPKTHLHKNRHPAPKPHALRQQRSQQQCDGKMHSDGMQA